MRLTKAAIIAIISACVALGAASAAFAYPSSLTDPSAPSDSRTCADCHGREADEATETVAATRKGPHGGYTAGTRKCQTCHSVHDAPADGVLLLPGATVEATCTSCHDGTGAAAVYGVIFSRTSKEPAAAHSMSGVDATNTIPGGDGNTGGASTGSFSGPGGTLSCNDCHSPHDSQTVKPFTGDRLRASVTSDTAYAVEKTNRLLKQSPTSAETSVSVYGAGWCATCHEGRVAQHAEDSDLVQTHPVMDSDEEYYYDRVQGVAGADTTETALGSLGQSNRGYVVPEVEDPAADPRPAPLCQQCHEDARNVGPSERGTNPMLSEDQTFTVGVYAPPPSDEPTGNPQFQVFPHESNVEFFLVRPVEPAVEDTQTPRYGLCLSCHSLRHDVPQEYEWCIECHDAGDAADLHETATHGCFTCHPFAPQAAAEPEPGIMALAESDYTPQLTLDCGTAGCHDDDPHVHRLAAPGSDFVQLFNDHDGLTGGFGVVVECAMCHNVDVVLAHANRCVTCHPVPRTSFDVWEPGCQQGGCHPTFHDDTIEAHWSTDADANKCGVCHGGSGPGSQAVQPDSCLNCHSGFSAGDTTPPVTSSNALATYVGPARIDFSITEGDLIGIGTTFYSVDGGPPQVGSSAFVEGVGVHVLEYWSMDQNGNLETPQTATFTVEADLEPPVTTSNVAPGQTYYTTRTFTLAATDNGTLGVKNTYYELYLAGTLVQSGTGTQLTVLPPASGTADYILHYWSVDHSGNAEERKSVSFTMAGGTGTIQLIWDGWGNVPGSTGPAWGALSYKVWQGSVEPTGGWVHQGTDDPTWGGVDNVVVNVSPQQYSVRILCLEEDGLGNWVGEDDFTVSVLVDEDGKVVQVEYVPY